MLITDMKVDWDKANGIDELGKQRRSGRMVLKKH